MEREPNVEKLIASIQADEKRVALENLFNDDELIQHTIEEIQTKLAEYERHVVKALDDTIESMHLLYHGTLKTRFILVAACTYTLLARVDPEAFSNFQSGHIRTDRKRVTSTNTVLTFFTKYANGRSQRRIAMEKRDDSHEFDYLLQLIDELLPLLPKRMSNSFRELNEMVLKPIGEVFPNDLV
ncbi:hypothetical protein FE782_01745 [Paenibacillus antri]|uniref:Uncharacterized protein n=1 Tax=Paenibacillus antri TaxID=2582848 RepID=A0A5R9GC90_9BACL|nr:hypothetical protein [Paenibacillus antri]TLS54092.1 hypothetical protein FE782_01745 [Paenibacillus antri]